MTLHLMMMWFFGSLGNLGKFSVKSVYNAMASNDSGPYHKKIWKGKIPAKIKIFLWLMMNNAVLTKDNLLKRKWVGDPSCYFCKKNETVSHFFFQCSTTKSVWAIVAKSIGANNVPRSLEQCWAWCDKWLPNGKQFHVVGVAAICWAIWKTRNKACFDGKLLNDPISVICDACVLIGYWAGLFAEGDKESLVDGANTMLAIALKILGKRKKMDGDVPLRDGPDDDKQS
jgi:hypothetical protein